MDKIGYNLASPIKLFRNSSIAEYSSRIILSRLFEIRQYRVDCSHKPCPSHLPRFFESIAVNFIKNMFHSNSMMVTYFNQQENFYKFLKFTFGIILASTMWFVSCVSIFIFGDDYSLRSQKKFNFICRRREILAFFIEPGGVRVLNTVCLLIRQKKTITLKISGSVSVCQKVLNI